jgi:repressor LexA
MIGANIHSGDIVFIRQQEEVEDGEIAAVLVDDSATLKRFYRHDGAVELRPENPHYRSMIFTADNCNNFRVLGKAVALQTLIK